jgi:hypothetical protein
MCTTNVYQVPVDFKAFSYFTCFHRVLLNVHTHMYAYVKIQIFSVGFADMILFYILGVLIFVPLS